MEPKTENEGDNKKNSATLLSQKQLEGTKKKLKQSKPKKKKESKKKQKSSPCAVVKDISKDEFASKLIKDLVKCYTNNPNLSPEKVEMLNNNFYNRSIALFSSIINNCVEAIYTKLIESDYFSQWIFNEATAKVDACCQTDITLLHPLDTNLKQEDSNESQQESNT